jgi:hypothetical protein
MTVEDFVSAPKEPSAMTERVETWWREKYMDVTGLN